ncbi:MADF domain-containing protein, partial [Aphis craccivora]
FCNTFQVTLIILNFNIYFVVILCLGSKNDNFEESISNELSESRSIAVSTVNEVDGDTHFCKFVTFLMKNLTKKKKNNNIAFRSYILNHYMFGRLNVKL